jgi:monothiol glutaredoxin
VTAATHLIDIEAAAFCQRTRQPPGTRDMSNQQAVQDHIRKLVSDHDVVLFMKGNKSMAQCGFSHQVDAILQHLGVDYKDVNVLADMGIREGIKSFSNWPTIPQLYVKGEFQGGCDIVREMFQSGELQQLLDEKGVKHTKKTAVA